MPGGPQGSGASPEMLVGTVDKPVIPPRIWLFVFIIAHILEGMAVGVSAGEAWRCQIVSPWALPQMVPSGW